VVAGTDQLHETTDDPPLKYVSTKHVPRQRRQATRHVRERGENRWCKVHIILSVYHQRACNNPGMPSARRRHTNEFHNKCPLISTYRSGRSQSDMYATQVQAKQRYTNKGFSSSAGATSLNSKHADHRSGDSYFTYPKDTQTSPVVTAGGRQRFRHSSPVITFNPGVQ
jgi:hypothetical protein